MIQALARRWPLILILSCLPLGAGSAIAAPAAKAWPQKMRALEKSYQDLLVELNSDERFNSPKNFKHIQAQAKEFAKLAADLRSKEGAAPDADPSIKLFANLFAEEAARASKTLEQGHRAYARNVLKSMTNYCMACHTRSNIGPSFESAADVPAVKNLKPLERADYFASVRQFDRALTEYDRVLADSSLAEHRPFEWERAIRSGLAVAIRVKKDPERALDIVERVLKSPKAPYFLKEQAMAWKADLVAWKAEPKAIPQTEEGYRAQAIKLLAAAKTEQEYPADRSADVLYLRASSAVHDLMSFAPDGAHATEALYLAGLCYEVLQDLNLWDLHEFYYLACVYKQPHSEQARQCYRNFEKSIYLAYTGSGGTDLPPDVARKLKELDTLSNPVTPATNTPEKLH